MAKVISEPSIKSRGLAKWRQPILDTVAASFPGSKLNFMPVPRGLAWLAVYWDGFYGRKVVERQAMVRRALEQVGPEASKRIVLVYALTLEEAEDADSP